MCLFHKDADYAAFERVLAEGIERYPVELLTYCLMNNHWHLVLRPRTNTTLGRFMGWVGVTHVRRHHEHYHSRGGGHLYQGRFKSFPVQDDAHFLTLCRYVEANALRAGVVRRAEEWPWGALYARERKSKPLVLATWPVQRPPDWKRMVNTAIGDTELDKLRMSVCRGRPWGADEWVQPVAQRLGLEFTFRNAGRPVTQGGKRGHH